MTRSSDLETLAVQHAALAAELAEHERELSETRTHLDEARQRRRLPVFAEIRVASPCRADWSRMVGDDRVRHCGDCKRYVYNLSAMTRAEAEALIGSLENAPCIRYYERADGTILFADCTVLRSQRRRGRLTVAGAALAAAAGIASLATMEPERSMDLDEMTITVMGEFPTPLDGEAEAELEPDDGQPVVVMGDIAQRPEPPISEEVARAVAVSEAERLASGYRPHRPPPLPKEDPAYLGLYRQIVPFDEQ
jgi:hypothetical protein